MNALEFLTITSFLNETSEIEGRGLTPLSKEEERQIRELADGQLDDDERDALLPTLRFNATALEHLAAEIKQHRPGGANPAQV
jgi:broad specificity phosphatase PhoE